ncbi:hypothetical protein OG21DRAFT_1526837 [Imleria badia]|nr:hypothetical protein OG21DRAFT_1526837 [Imleria badia]
MLGLPMTTGNEKSPTGIGPGPRALTPMVLMSTTRLTRQSTLAQKQAPMKEDSFGAEYTVRDAKGGAAYLNSLLLSMLKGVLRPAIESIWAVAFLLEQEAIMKIACTVAEEVALRVTSAIAPHMANLLKISEDLSVNLDLANHIKSAATTFTSGANEVKEADSIKSFLTMAANLVNNPHSQTPAKSYSEVLHSQMTSAHLTTPLPAQATLALARAALWEHQILIDPQCDYSFTLRTSLPPP